MTVNVIDDEYWILLGKNIQFSLLIVNVVGFGTPGMGVQSAFGPGMQPSSRVVPSNTSGFNPRQAMPYGPGNLQTGNYAPVGYRVPGPMGGQNTGRYTPTARSVTAPVYG